MFAVPSSPVMVLINPSTTGVVTAGSRYTLTCIALKTASGLTQFATTQWTGPDGSPIVTGGSVVLFGAATESLRTVQNITFGSIPTSDAGMYHCASSLTSPALSSPFQTAQSHAVIVSGILKLLSSQ